MFELYRNFAQKSSISNKTRKNREDRLKFVKIEKEKKMKYFRNLATIVTNSNKNSGEK